MDRELCVVFHSKVQSGYLTDRQWTLVIAELVVEIQNRRPDVCHSETNGMNEDKTGIDTFGINKVLNYVVVYFKQQLNLM